MKVMLLLFALAGLLTSPAMAQSAAGSDSQDRQLRALADLHAKDPKAAQALFDRLFQAPDLTKQLNQGSPSAAPPFRPQPPSSEVICGLKIWRVDASQDPRIIVPIPQSHVDPKIRRIIRDVCRDTLAPKR